MIYLKDSIKIGHKVEYVFDILDHAPFDIHESESDNCYIVSTDKGEIMVTGETHMMTADGVYIRADQLKPYAHALKHVSGPAIVYDSYFAGSAPMVEVCDTDYIVVNGFTISPDMI